MNNKLRQIFCIRYISQRLTFALLLLAFSLTGCGRSDDVVTEEIIRPIKTLKLGEATTSLIRRYPAQIYASNRAEVSFRVPGKVTELLIKEGDFVDEGQVLAKLDPTDYKLAVNDAEAQFNRANSNFERAKKLVKKGFISKSDYDKLESEFKTTRAALNRAKNDLAYATLKAPFKGRVGKRYIQNFEEVQAKQAVFSMQSSNKLDVKFNVPERVVMRIRSGDSAEESEQRVKEREQRAPFVFLLFSDKNKRYPLRFKEIATRADEQTRTFEVTFSLDAPDDITVLPGMTAEVEVNFARVYEDSVKSLSVPSKVVFADPQGNKKQYVWVVNETTMQVELREVQVGRLSGENIQILSGLQGDERIVAAGVHSLQDGQKVRLFEKLKK